MEIDKKSLNSIYKEAKERSKTTKDTRKRREDVDDEFEPPEDVKVREYNNAKHNITKILEGLYHIINQKPATKKSDLDYEPNVMTSCVILPLMTMPSTKKDTFIARIRNGRVDDITPEQKIEYINNIYRELSTVSIEASNSFLKEYYLFETDYSDTSDNAEFLLQKYNDEWHEQFKEWLLNIINEINDEKAEKRVLNRISQKVTNAATRYFTHNPAANIPFPTSFCRSGETENLLGQISYIKSDPILSDFDSNEKAFILKLLEDRIDKAIQDWYNTVDTAFERKRNESDFYIDTDLL